MPPRSRPEEVPTYDLTSRRVRLVAPAPIKTEVGEPSPLLEAIRAYLERAR